MLGKSGKIHVHPKMVQQQNKTARIHSFCSVRERFSVLFSIFQLTHPVVFVWWNEKDRASDSAGVRVLSKGGYMVAR